MANVFQILFKFKKEGNAVEEVQKQTDKLTDSVKKASDALGKQAEATGKLNKSLDDSAQAGQEIGKLEEGFNALGSGRILGGVKNLTAGLRGLWAAMKANPVGAIIAGVTMLVSVFIKWQNHAKAVYAEQMRLKELQKVSATEAKAIATNVGEVNNASLDAAINRGRLLGEQYTRAADELARVRTAMDALEDADLATALAGLEFNRQRTLAGSTDESQRGVINADFDLQAQALRNDHALKKASEAQARATEDLNLLDSAIRTATEEVEKLSTLVATAPARADTQFDEMMKGRGWVSDQETIVNNPIKGFYTPQQEADANAALLSGNLTYNRSRHELERKLEAGDEEAGKTLGMAKNPQAVIQNMAAQESAKTRAALATEAERLRNLRIKEQEAQQQLQLAEVNRTTTTLNAAAAQIARAVAASRAGDVAAGREPRPIDTSNLRALGVPMGSSERDPTRPGQEPLPSRPSEAELREVLNQRLGMERKDIVNAQRMGADPSGKFMESQKADVAKVEAAIEALNSNNREIIEALITKLEREKARSADTLARVKNLPL